MLYIFVKSKNIYFWTFIRRTFWTFLKSSLANWTLISKESDYFFLMNRPWKFGLGTCFSLPYLTSKGKIIEAPPPSILDKNIGIGLRKNRAPDNSFSLRFIVKHTKFTETEVLEWWDGFLYDCPRLKMLLQNSFLRKWLFRYLSKTKFKTIKKRQNILSELKRLQL